MSTPGFDSHDDPTMRVSPARVVGHNGTGGSQGPSEPTAGPDVGDTVSQSPSPPSLSPVEPPQSPEVFGGSAPFDPMAHDPVLAQLAARQAAQATQGVPRRRRSCIGVGFSVIMTTFFIWLALFVGLPMLGWLWSTGSFLLMMIPVIVVGVIVWKVFSPSR